jgi:hypothetical protein
MAQTIKLKRSATAGNTPTTSQLALGELGINTTDGKLFLKKSVSGTESIIEVGSTGSFLPLSGGTLTGNLSLGDGVSANFGAGSDLQIYHDGSHSYVSDTGTGYLRLKGSNYVQIFDASDAVMANFESGGSVYLAHNGADRFATTATGIDVTGSVVADGLTVDGGTASPIINLSRSGTYSGITFSQTVTNVTGAGADLSTYSLNANTGYVWQTTDSGGTFAKALLIAPNRDISFYEDTGTTPKMVWDASAEELQIGGNLLNLSGVSSGTTGARISANGNGTLRLASGGVDALTIVDGGNATFSGIVTSTSNYRVNEGNSLACLLYTSDAADE